MVRVMDVQVSTHDKTCASCRAGYGDSNAPSGHAQNPRSEAWSRSAASTGHPWSRTWTKIVCMANPTHLVELVTVILMHCQGALRTHGVRRGHALQPRHPWLGSRTTKPVCMAKPAHLVELDKTSTKHYRQSSNHHWTAQINPEQDGDHRGRPKT